MSSPRKQLVPGHEELVPDPQVQKEFGITAMTLWRWDQDDELDFPPPINIRKKNYRSRQLLEQFKQRMVTKAIDTRAKKRRAKDSATDTSLPDRK